MAIHIADVRTIPLSYRCETPYMSAAGVQKAGSQGPMVAECAALRGLAVREAWPGPDVWLVLRRQSATGAWKPSLCHAPVDTALETCVRRSGMRWPIATRFEDGKQLLGMGDMALP